MPPEGPPPTLLAMSETARRTIAGVLAAACAAVLLECIYRLLLRDPLLTWGATAAEADRRLPGDELLEVADVVATRAIDIDAPPAAVWPWLARLGSRRGMHRADRIVRELQHVQVGDLVPIEPDGTGLSVAVLE